MQHISIALVTLLKSSIYAPRYMHFNIQTFPQNTILN